MKTLFRASDATETVDILIDHDHPIASFPPVSIPEILKRTVETYPNHTALKYKDFNCKAWKRIDYKNYRDQVEKMAKVFIKIGLARRGTVAFLAVNSVEWFISELGAIHAG